MVRIGTLKPILLLFTGVILITSCRKVDLQPFLEKGTKLQETPSSSFSRPAFVPNEVLVKFKDGSTSRSRSATFELIGGIVEEHILTTAMESRGETQGLYRIKTPHSVEKAIAILQGDDRIEYVQPNHIFYPLQSVASNDPMLSMQWGATNLNSNSSRAETAWRNGSIGSTAVFIGIVDEGVMFNHEDLTGNVINPREIPGNRKDDDGNGIVDDVYGRDFVANDNTVFDGLTDDHGTHVAGIIGALGNISMGIAGMAWQVRMINAKFISPTGGTEANAVRALDYMTTLRTLAKVPIVAVNCSWNTPTTLTSANLNALQGAVNRMQAADILLIAAVGNNGEVFDFNRRYPAGFSNPNIIRVTSINSIGAISSGANTGTSFVDIAAPGTDIQSTIPVSLKGKPVSGYGNMSGTSQAAAFVTGAVALYKAKNPTATAAQIKEAILNRAKQNLSLINLSGPFGRTLDVSTF